MYTEPSTPYMERLPEMFGIIRPGYGNHKYISFYKNTIEIRKKGVYNDAAPRGRRWSEEDIECNTIEKVPVNDAFLCEESVYSTYEKKRSIVCVKNFKSSFRSEGEYYIVLPFVICYHGDMYPVVAFYHGSWLPATVNAIYKLILTEEEKRSISLALHMLDPRYYDHPDAVDFTMYVLQDDVKEPEPIPNIPNKLPTFVIENHIHCEIARSECPITTIGLKECDRVSMLDCYHVFDSASIHTWMRIKAECPVCKGKSKIIHTLSVPESLRSPAISLPAAMIEPATLPAVPKKSRGPRIAPK